MTGHKGVVIHTASGYYEGTISWQMKSLDAMHAAGESATSSHFVVGQKVGEVAQLLDTDVQSWAQKSGNADWLSIEFAGFSDPLTDWQMKCCAKILKKANAVYGVPIQIATSPSGRGLGHHSMGYESGANWGHQFCPGEKIKAQKPAIVALAKGVIPEGLINMSDCTFFSATDAPPDKGGPTFFGIPGLLCSWVKDADKAALNGLEDGKWIDEISPGHTDAAAPGVTRNLIHILGEIPPGFEAQAAFKGGTVQATVDATQVEASLRKVLSETKLAPSA